MIEHVVVSVVAAVTGGGWLLSKVSQRIHELETKVERLPMEYVLKADYVRELGRLNDEFTEINVKLDKIIENRFGK
jgi:Tfp pilus assembly protein PilO